MSPPYEETSNISIGKQSGESEEILTYDPKPLSIMSHDTVNQENFRDSENEGPATMDSISSFLETMHSKNLTLKKLAKVQQRRIDELSRENNALRQTSDVKDEEILKLKTHLNTLRTAPGHIAQPEKVQVPTPNQKKNIPHGHQQPTCKNSATARNGNEQSNQTSAGQRHKPSIIVSHKVAVKRVMRLVKKINGTYNRKSVGLYTFLHGFAHVVLPLLVSISRDTPTVLHVHCR